MEFKMNVIILAGGKGTRLRPLTFAIPKPLIPVGEKPILELLLEKLALSGFKKIFLAVGYRAELIETYFGDGKRFGIDLFYEKEERPLGTAGPARLIYGKHGLTGPCLVLNADLMTKINFKQLVKWHQRKAADMTVACADYEYKVPYGTFDLEGESIKKVREKPALNFNISTGIYILERKAINLILRYRKFDMPALMKKMIDKKMRLLAYPLRAQWSAIETIEDLEDFYKRANSKFTVK